MNLLKKWWQNYFAHESGVALIVMLFLSGLIIFFLGDVLTPVFISIIFSFILQKPINLLVKYAKLNQTIALLIIYCIAMSIVVILVLFILPIIIKQTLLLSYAIPKMIGTAKAWLLLQAVEYPQIFAPQIIQELSTMLTNETTNFFLWMVSFSLSSISNLVTISIYMLLVPIFVFLLLKDQNKITVWIGKTFTITTNHTVIKINQQILYFIGRYINGKLVEIVIVSVVTYAAFFICNLQYALLLSILAGISVVIPYIGAIVVTIPIVVVALFQYDVTAYFFYVLTAHLLIQFIDGNMLVPALFSEAVHLSPIAILLSILVFGGLWGVGGIFFAIPLAIVIKVLIQLWPHKSVNQS